MVLWIRKVNENKGQALIFNTITKEKDLISAAFRDPPMQLTVVPHNYFGIDRPIPHLPPTYF